jgi:hypothetical protein
VTEMKDTGHPVAGLIDKPGQTAGRPVTPGRPGALNPDAPVIRRHSQVVRLADYARGAGSRPGDRDEDNHPDVGQACRAMAGYERDHAARHGGDLLHGRIGAQRIACGDTARPHVRQGYLGLLADAQQLQPVAAKKQQRRPRGARPQRRTVKDRWYGQRHRCRGSAGRVVTRVAGPAQRQMNSDAAGDQHDGQARYQPPADRIAAIGITATADNVEGRPVRHKLNVSAVLVA